MTADLRTALDVSQLARMLNDGRAGSSPIQIIVRSSDDVQPIFPDTIESVMQDLYTGEIVVTLSDRFRRPVAPPRILVEVEGGVVQSVYTSIGLKFNVDILDHDDMKQEHPDSTEYQRMQALCEDRNKLEEIF